MTQDNKTPVWKSDFPIKQDDTSRISRRKFAKILCLASGGLALGTGGIAVKSLFSSKAKPIGEHLVCEVSKLPVGEMFSFVLDDKNETPCILIHLDEEKWRCFEQKCTHLSCSVLYRSDLNEIQCPCHHGAFNPENGEVLQGPPPRPLPQLSVIIRDDNIYVTEKA
jgi:nitrite reductase/ring-hydroxylating ferredoxin subunit